MTRHRRALRAQRERDRQHFEHVVKATQGFHICSRFEDAFMKLYGHRIVVHPTGSGWYLVGKRNYRLREIEKLTHTIEARLHELELGEQDEK